MSWIWLRLNQLNLKLGSWSARSTMACPIVDGIVDILRTTQKDSHFDPKVQFPAGLVCQV